MNERYSKLTRTEKKMLTRARNAVTIFLSRNSELHPTDYISLEDLKRFVNDGMIRDTRIKGIGKKSVAFLEKFFAETAEAIEVKSMTEAEYNAAEGIRRSDLWVMNDSPEKFRFRMDNAEETTAPALIFGAAAHKWVLEEDQFCNEYAVAPNVDGRTKEGKEIKARFAEENAGKTIISQDDFDTIVSMKETMKKNPLVEKIMFGKGQNEIPFFWTDPETGEKCKVKCDRVIQDDEGRYVLIDYKTAQYAATEHFNRAVIIHGYHLQAAMYTEGLQIALHLDRRPRFLFVAQEKKAPFSVNVIEVSYDVMNFGDGVYHDLLQKYHACKEMDIWEGYIHNGEINQTSLPKWAMNEMEEDE